MNILVFLRNLVIFLVPAALLALNSARLAKTSQDEWQLLAWVPGAPLAIWGCFIAWGVTRDPTSHNLWPFELVTWSALSGALLVLFLLARRLMSRRRPNWGPRHDRENR